MPTADKVGRVAGFEIMYMTAAIENLVRENKTYRINSSIQTGKKYGMVLLDDFLFSLFRKGKITYQEMMQKSQDNEMLQKKVKEATAQAGG